jgi:hypothetical protein
MLNRHQKMSLFCTIAEFFKKLKRITYSFVQAKVLVSRKKSMNVYLLVSFFENLLISKINK